MTTPATHRAGTHLARPERRTLLVGALLLLFALPVARLVAEERPSFQEIEESLTCQCGCGLTVHSCNHLQCPSALPLRAEIREQLGQNKNKAEILTYFEDKYGEKILSAPTTVGFNILAWTTPFVAVLIGIALVIAIARSWRRGSGRDEIGAANAPTKPTEDSAYRDVLEREMKDFDS